MYLLHETKNACGYGVWGKSKSKSNTCGQEEADSLEIIPIYLAVYCKVRKANFASFPRKSPDKARAVFRPYIGLRPELKKGLWLYYDKEHTSLQDCKYFFPGRLILLLRK